MPESPSLFTAEEYKKNFKPNKKIEKREEKVQIRVCDYLHKTYPKVIFTCDLSSGMKLPIHIAAKNKQMRSSRGLPDLFIAKTSKRPLGKFDMMGNEMFDKPFNGLFIELKSGDKAIFKSDGTLYKDPHLYEQNAILESLREEGYMAVFACGFDEAKKIIDDYLSIK